MKNNVPHFTESMFYSLEQIARYLELHSHALFAQLSDGEITPEEFRTIDVIVCHPDICQRDLAKLILRDRVRTGRILDSLEAKKIIERFGDLKNKRLVKKMKLTEKGEKLFNELTEKIHPYIEALKEHFTQEQILELKKLLNALKKGLSEIVELPA